MKMSPNATIFELFLIIRKIKESSLNSVSSKIFYITIHCDNILVKIQRKIFKQNLYRVNVGACIPRYKSQDT